MAIIIEGSSTCSICGKTLKESDNVIVWSHFLPEEHKLWEFSDSGMHRECFESWEYKDEFNHLHNYQPMVDFDDPELIDFIELHGMPDWMKVVKEYRAIINKK